MRRPRVCGAPDIVCARGLVSTRRFLVGKASRCGWGSACSSRWCVPGMHVYSSTYAHTRGLGFSMQHTGMSWAKASARTTKGERTRRKWGAFLLGLELQAVALRATAAAQQRRGANGVSCWSAILPFLALVSS